MELTNDHWRWVKAHVRHFKNWSSNEAELEDLAQEAFIAMWMEIEKARKEGREINDSYLYQKARWVVLSAVRRPLMEVPWCVDTVRSLRVDPPDRDAVPHYPELLAAVRDLPERQRQYVYLRFWEGLSVKTELAALGYTRNVWYASQTGARATLRARLDHLATAY